MDEKTAISLCEGIGRYTMYPYLMYRIKDERLVRALLLQTRYYRMYTTIPDTREGNLLSEMERFVWDVMIDRQNEYEDKEMIP